MKTNSSTQWSLSWAHGEVVVQALGGMLAPLRFDLPDGISISPLQVAPWGQVPDPALPGVLRQLRGEWPCVPFGASKAPSDLPAGWSAHACGDDWDHGYTSNHDWSLVEQTAQWLRVAIDYPDDNAVRRLEREVRPDPQRPAITVTLTVHVRSTTRMPLALHPTFAVPLDGLELLPPASTGIYSYPIPTEAGVSRLTAGGYGPDLAAMPGKRGSLDLTRLPLPFVTEELMQMCDCKPPFKLRYPGQQVELQLDWDSSVLPDALIWISNGGRQHAPWSGRHFALGIEPMSGFFDLGRVVVPTADHPLAHKQGLSLTPDKPLVISYSIAAAPIPGVF